MSKPANGRFLPFGELCRAARGVGAIDVQVDADGIYRTLEPVRGYEKRSFPSLALAPFPLLDDSISSISLALGQGYPGPRKHASPSSR